MSGVRIVDMPDLGTVNDTSSIVGESGGSGRFSATALKSYIAGAVAVPPSGTLPLMDGTASAGSSATYAMGDHVHPSDSRIAALEARIAYIESHFIKST